MQREKEILALTFSQALVDAHVGSSGRSDNNGFFNRTTGAGWNITDDKYPTVL
ncbi:hypothetical protein [Pyxidicoccus xibeiensis]|uniref:hypothetical protein n=1 Tax=Pyxidicoccus xibeiensis TaxID=2906759 RepID=UPI0020A7657B|nr:hypothetical protein [Pyxidicoccus xibeiensis]MCP3144952.1 hypothetical protein [Pyxidicoccus xibeiensis]